MKKTLATAVLMVTLGAGLSWAASYPELPFMPASAELLGRGGSLVADTTGYSSFFANPAGFSRDGESITLVDASTWVYSRPDQFLTFGQQMIAGTTTPLSILGFLNDQVTTGGIGIGGTLGIGYVGNGLGLGTIVIMDSLLSGPTLLGVTGDLTATFGFIGGLSVPFDVLGIRIHVGGAVRPMIRAHVPVDSSVAMGMLTALATGGDPFAALASANALYGVGIGLDLGAIAEMGWFNAGISIRDLAGTQFRYSTSTFGVLQGTFMSQIGFPTTGTLATDTYTIPMDIAIGLAFHPDLGTFGKVIDVSIDADMHDVIGAIAGTASVWTLLHVGAEVKLLSIVSLRGGLDQGYLSMGAGLKLFFLDVNVALFTRELGAHIGDKPSSGATVDVAIRW